MRARFSFCELLATRIESVCSCGLGVRRSIRASARRGSWSGEEPEAPRSTWRAERRVRESSCCALRASGQQPASAPPFSTCSRSVRFHVRGVYHLRVSRSSAAGQFPEQVLPHAAPRPAHEAVIDRCRRTILGRAIAPATAAPQHVHDAADDAAIIHPLDAPC